MHFDNRIHGTTYFNTKIGHTMRAIGAFFFLQHKQFGSENGHYFCGKSIEVETIT